MTDRRAWSYSALKTYESCPRKWAETALWKNVQEAPSEHMTHGNVVHKAFENYCMSQTRFPIGMRHFENYVKPFLQRADEKGYEIMVEQKLALTHDLQPTTWFAKNVWVRSIVDFAMVGPDRAIIIDWKTGKRKDDMDQLALMAATFFAQAEELVSIQAAFVWLQEPWPQAYSPVAYERDDLPRLWGRFLEREERFQHSVRDNNFPEHPSGLCKNWCPVKACSYCGG